MFYFKTFPNGTEWSPRFVVFGDLGNVNGRTLGRLQDQVQRGEHDLILHLGDMAYDMHTDDAKVGDEFMRQIEPMAAYVPYQVRLCKFITIHLTTLQFIYTGVPRKP